MCHAGGHLWNTRRETGALRWPCRPQHGGYLQSEVLGRRVPPTCNLRSVHVICGADPISNHDGRVTCSLDVSVCAKSLEMARFLREPLCETNGRYSGQDSSVIVVEGTLTQLLHFVLPTKE